MAFISNIKNNSTIKRKVIILMSIIFINLFPIFMIFTAKVLDNKNFKPSFYWILVIFSLLSSKLWFPLNTDLNLYFMHFGS
ncbi:MAG: hypothetical protein Q7K55_07340 [Candidatus Levybacteria bacterium]|nr:hypothetical protein [Candidatus Levybacteria bacterium]